MPCSVNYFPVSSHCFQYSETQGAYINHHLIKKAKHRTKAKESYKADTYIYMMPWNTLDSRYSFVNWTPICWKIKSFREKKDFPRWFPETVKG